MVAGKRGYTVTVAGQQANEVSRLSFSIRCPRAITASALLLLGAAALAHADTAYQAEAKFASSKGTVIYLAASLAMPILEDGGNGGQDALRTADSLLTSSVITEALKHITKEPRPDSPNDKSSFPSGHASAAFAAATMESHYHPRQAWLWYTGATLIGASRVELRAHRTTDVIAGAVLGIGASRLEISRPHGLILFPFIKPEDGGSGRTASAGIGLSRTF